MSNKTQTKTATQFSQIGHERAKKSRQKPADLGLALALLISWGREDSECENALKSHEAENETVKDADISEEKNDERQQENEGG